MSRECDFLNFSPPDCRFSHLRDDNETCARFCVARVAARPGTHRSTVHPVRPAGATTIDRCRARARRAVPVISNSPPALCAGLIGAELEPSVTAGSYGWNRIPPLAAISQIRRGSAPGHSGPASL